MCRNCLWQGFIARAKGWANKRLWVIKEKLQILQSLSMSASQPSLQPQWTVLHTVLLANINFDFYALTHCRSRTWSVIHAISFADTCSASHTTHLCSPQWTVFHTPFLAVMDCVSPAFACFRWLRYFENRLCSALQYLSLAMCYNWKWTPVTKINFM